MSDIVIGAAALISATGTILGTIYLVAHWLWRRFENKINEGRAVLVQGQDAQLAEQKATNAHLATVNGTVAAIINRVSSLEGAVAILKENR